MHKNHKKLMDFLSTIDTNMPDGIPEDHLIAKFKNSFSSLRDRCFEEGWTYELNGVHKIKKGGLDALEKLTIRYLMFQNHEIQKKQTRLVEQQKRFNLILAVATSILAFVAIYENFYNKIPEKFMPKMIFFFLFLFLFASLLFLLWREPMMD